MLQAVDLVKLLHSLSCYNYECYPTPSTSLLHVRPNMQFLTYYFFHQHNVISTKIKNKVIIVVFLKKYYIIINICNKTIIYNMNIKCN